MMWDKLALVRINIQLTKACNQRCLSCSSYNIPSQTDFPEEKVAEFVEYLCKHNEIKNIAFTGGEPTLSQSLLRLAKFFSQLSPNISLTSNGQTLSNISFLNSAVTNGINRFSYSYHGVGKHDAFTRVRGAEKKVRAAVECTKAISRSNAEIYVKMGSLFDGDNLEDIIALREYGLSIGVPLYIELLESSIPIFHGNVRSVSRKSVECKQLARAYDTFSNWISDGSVLLTEQGLRFMKKYFSGESIRGRCPLGKSDLYVDSEGFVYSGCWYLPPVGNVRESSPQEILQHPSYAENIRAMTSRHCPGCTCGYLMQANFME